MFRLDYYIKSIKSLDMLNTFMQFKDFYMEKYCYRKYRRNKFHLVNLIEEINCIELRNLSWDLLCNISKNDNYCLIVRNSKIRTILEFILFILDNQEIEIDQKRMFLENKKNILNLVEHQVFNLNELNSKTTCPQSILNWTYKKENVTYIVQSKNVFLLKLFQEYMNNEFIQTSHIINNSMLFFSIFEESILPYEVSGYHDFCDEMFFSCIKRTALMTKDIKIGQRGSFPTRVISFFQWLVSSKPNSLNFHLIDTVLLTYNHLAYKLINDYVVVKYSPYEKTKFHKRMILIPSSDDSHIKGQSYKVVSLDVSDIENNLLRCWYTDFFWKCQTDSLYFRNKVFSKLKQLLIQIDKSYKPNDIDVQINEKDVFNYITICSVSGSNDSSIACDIYQLKKFLNYLELECKVKVKPVLYNLLTFKESERNSKKDAYLSKEIEKIISYLQVKNPLIALAVSIITSSEIRKESVLNLKVDCLEKTLSLNGNDEYVVKIHTKRSDNEIEYVNINKYVKAYIEEALKMTENNRLNMTSYDKEYIFVRQVYGRRISKRLKSDSISNATKMACKELNIDYKGTHGYRNYYMQFVSEHISRENLSASFIPSLTGHSLQIHLSNYDQMDMIKFCEQFYNVSIGNVYLKGSIKKEANYDRKNIVVNNCGFCSKNHCDIEGQLDCFMCKSFITTLSCIPFFERSIDEIDKRIIKETISHEKDFLLSKKKLLVGYLSQLFTLKENLNEE